MSCEDVLVLVLASSGVYGEGLDAWVKGCACELWGKSYTSGREFERDSAISRLGIKFVFDGR